VHDAQISRVAAVATSENFGSMLEDEHTFSCLPGGASSAQCSVSAANYEYIVRAGKINQFSPNSSRGRRLRMRLDKPYVKCRRCLSMKSLAMWLVRVLKGILNIPEIGANAGELI
jgi:hypothetical protein